MNLQNLQQGNSILSMIKITQTMVKEVKMVQPKQFETQVIKSNPCAYSGAYILVTGAIAPTCGDANTRIALKSCALFTKCISHINDEHIDSADNLDIIMHFTKNKVFH